MDVDTVFNLTIAFVMGLIFAVILLYCSCLGSIFVVDDEESTHHEGNERTSNHTKTATRTPKSLNTSIGGKGGE